MTDSELLALLEGASALVTAVGADDDGNIKIYNGELPEKCGLPAVTFEYISTRPDNTLEGYTGEGWDRISFNVWANDQVTADDLKTTLINAIAAEGWPLQSKEKLNEPEYRVYRYALDFSIYR